jgi:curli biogenesis system outer membrane secretion channel CsgG
MRTLTQFLIPIISILFTYCSTVKPPITSTIPLDTVQVSKTISEKPERFLKRKVAIARFSNETKYGKGFFSDLNEDRVGKQAMDILSAKLTETDKFILLERADLEKLIDEKEIANLNSFNIPADYLILGSVVEFGRKTTSDVGVFNRTKKQTAYAKVNVRLVDVKTSRIVYTEEGEGEAFTEAETVLGIGNTAEYDATLNDKVINAAISKLVNNIVEKLLDVPWRSYLLSYEDGNYFIAGGILQGIKEGDVFSVYKHGNKVINPQTNVEIELPGKFVGKIKVESTIPGDALTELSVCSVISGDIPTEDFNSYYIQEN